MRQRGFDGIEVNGKICASKGFDRKLDEDIATVMCAISMRRPWFKGTTRCRPRRGVHDGDGASTSKQWS